jgi:thioredoxin-dependent peroxiredoxin
MGLAIGDRVPDFSLPTHAGETWTLSESLKKGPIVLFFYPKDDTPICIVEACTFRDHHEVFARRGAQVVGVSSDDVASHVRFAGKHELPYTLLSDQGGRVRKSFGVKKTLGFFDGRVTFVIGADGVLAHRYSSALDAKGHVAEAIAALERVGSPC